MTSLQCTVQTEYLKSAQGRFPLSYTLNSRVPLQRKFINGLISKFISYGLIINKLCIIFSSSTQAFVMFGCNFNYHAIFWVKNFNKHVASEKREALNAFLNTYRKTAIFSTYNDPPQGDPIGALYSEKINEAVLLYVFNLLLTVSHFGGFL